MAFWNWNGNIGTKNYLKWQIFKKFKDNEF